MDTHSPPWLLFGLLASFALFGIFLFFQKRHERRQTRERMQRQNSWIEDLEKREHSQRS